MFLPLGQRDRGALCFTVEARGTAGHAFAGGALTDGCCCALYPYPPRYGGGGALVGGALYGGAGQN